MDVLTSETCWAVNWHNKASVIKLVYLYSNIKMMHGSIRIRCVPLFIYNIIKHVTCTHPYWNFSCTKIVHKALVFVTNCTMKNTTFSYVTLCKVILLPWRLSVKLLNVSPHYMVSHHKDSTPHCICSNNSIMNSFTPHQDMRRHITEPGDKVTSLLTSLFFQLLICNLTTTSYKLICTGI